MDSKNIDIIVGAFLGLFSVAIYIYAEQYVGRGVNSYGPNFFPQALSGLLFIASLGLVVQAVRGRALKSLEAFNKPGLINVAATLAIAVSYLFLMKILGFYLSTVLFLYASMTFLKQKGQRVRILSSIIVATVVFSIFKFFLKIPLPQGIFEAAL
jgi:hypothetical protein